MLQPVGHKSPRTNDDEINLLDYWRVVMKYKKSIIVVVMLASVAAVVISGLIPKLYKAEALIVPVSSSGGGGGLANLASQFGGLASLAGVSFPSGATDDAAKMLAILKSRSLTENVINRENLMPILFEKMWDSATESWKTDDPQKKPSMENAVSSMKSAVNIMHDKKNRTIKVEGVFKDPKLAARVVNAYLNELQKFININAFTVAKRNRIFIERQLQENKRDLLESGKEINDFYSTNKISNVEAILDVRLGGELELPKLGTQDPGFSNKTGDLYALNDHPANPDSQDLATTLSGLLAQASDVKQKLADARVVRKVPQQVYLTYLMLRRELLAKVNALLTTQYEMAKIEESKEDLAFQVIDGAVPPEKKFKPKRAQICIMSFMAALVFAVFLAFFREYLQRMKSLNRDI